MRDKNIMQGNGHQFLKIGLCLWVRLICECDLYAKIYGTARCFSRGFLGLYWYVIRKHMYSLLLLFVVSSAGNGHHCYFK